jgi:hypothetical protein
VSAAEALKAAAAKRAHRPKPAPAAAAPAPARAKPRPAPEKKDRLAAYRTKKPAAVSGKDPITGLSGLPFMQRAVVLREILGPPPGLGSGGPLEREV